MSENAKLTQMMEIWDNKENKYAMEVVGLPEGILDKVLSTIFCPGPFYFFIMDFPVKRFSYVHSTIEDILGLKAKETTVLDLAARVHPDDAEHFIKCEERGIKFYFQEIEPSKINKYKISYCFRMLDKNNTYRLFHHQAIALSLDKENRISKVLAIHTDISHITEKNNHKISFISIDGSPSYLGLNLDGTPPPTKGFFTKREVEIIAFLAEGWNTNEIAKRLFIAPDTVRTHRNNIRKKLGVKNTTQLVAESIKAGLI